MHPNDSSIASKDPQDVIDALTNEHHFNLKEMGPISYHLGCFFGRHGDGTLYLAPRKCIEKMEECHHIMFGSKPKQLCISPLEKGDHPELDISKHLYQDGIQKHQYLIGAIQCAVSLGRLDFNTAIVALAPFRAEPREVQLDRARRVVSFLVKFKHTTIRIRTEDSDVSSMLIAPYE